MTPLVTIAIPTFSRLHYLKEAVASALAQTYTNIEILIGDDGDDPAIREWAGQQEKLSSKVRYQRNTHNLGLAGNWNAVVEGARGEYVIIIGDDDRLLPEFVRVCMEAVLPDGTLVFCNQHLIDENGCRLEQDTSSHQQRFGRDQLAQGWVSDPEACAWRNTIPMSATLLRTMDARRLRFKEDMNTPEIELVVRLAAEGGKFAFVPNCLAEYRLHSQSASSAGLSSERLAEYLIDIQVRPEVEGYKTTLLSQLMVNAVSRCIVAGDQKRAGRLFWSNYYPAMERRRPSGRLQRVAIRLPRAIGCSFYRVIRRIKGAFL
jgi:glycosyltransferase involved in cell wall biosynthesis